MFRTRIKICGITRSEDALAACEAGVDALGFVFWVRSKRAVTAAQIAPIVAELPPFVSTVGLFLDPEADEVSRVLDVLPLSMLQFHGNESPAFCRRFGRPYLKAVGMGGADPRAYAAQYPDAAGIMLDSHAQGQAGGTGAAFDWRQTPRDLGRPLILAGGLTPSNVHEAVRIVRPWAVDVSSGVERAPGIKDAQAIRDFAAGVRMADADASTREPSR